LTGYLSREECEYILKAINGQREADKFTGGFKDFTEEDWAAIERDREARSEAARLKHGHRAGETK
jgi:hypothetical protein